MTTPTPIDAAGTPQPNSLFAVFADAAAYQRAAAALQGLGLQPQRLDAQHTAALDSPDADAGLLGKLTRAVKSIGGETAMAQSYAQALQAGRVVLACHVDDQGAAEEATRQITAQGGYEVTYFRTLGIQYMSPAENAEHGSSPHSETNTDRS